MIPALLIWGNDPARSGQHDYDGGRSESSRGMGPLPVLFAVLALVGVATITYLITAVIWKIVTG